MVKAGRCTILGGLYPRLKPGARTGAGERRRIASSFVDYAARVMFKYPLLLVTCGNNHHFGLHVPVTSCLVDPPCLDLYQNFLKVIVPECNLTRVHCKRIVLIICRNSCGAHSLFYITASRTLFLMDFSSSSFPCNFLFNVKALLFQSTLPSSTLASSSASSSDSSSILWKKSADVLRS